MVGRKEIHDKLWEARNEEINHLWQRSIFLAAFLTVLITVYFTFAGSVLSDGKEIIGSISGAETYHADIFYESPEEIDDEDGKSLYDSLKEFISNRELLILEALSIVGFSFSVLWICMARGSKLSYERIEEGINKAYEGGFFDKELSEAIKKDFIKNLFALGDYTHTPMHGSLPDPDYSFRYFRVEGSKHSLSKVNILIGYLFIFIWIGTAIANPLIAGSGLYEWIISFVISIILMLFIRRILFVLSASDGYNWSRILRRIRRSERLGFDPDVRQNNYIVWLLLVENHNRNVIITRDHVRLVFSTYLNRCGDKLTRSLIDRLLEALDSHNGNLPEIIRAFRKDSFLKNMLETAIMYRTEIPLNFRGRWICRKNNLTLSLSRYSFTIDRLNVIAQDYSLNHIGGSFLLFADNMWHRIRSGSWSFEDCFLRSSVIHLLTEESDGAKLYIKLSLPDSLSSDIASSAVERMDAEVCRIDNSGTLSSNSFVFYRV